MLCINSVWSRTMKMEQKKVYNLDFTNKTRLKISLSTLKGSFYQYRLWETENVNIYVDYMIDNLTKLPDIYCTSRHYFNNLCGLAIFGWDQYRTALLISHRREHLKTIFGNNANNISEKLCVVEAIQKNWVICIAYENAQINFEI